MYMNMPAKTQVLPPTTSNHKSLIITKNVSTPPSPPKNTMSSESSLLSSSYSSTSAPPVGASCWLCLEEGPDDSGAPLVRDCSCRGHSGFAHLPCLVQYAESKSRDFVKRGACILPDMLFDEKFFEKCPNCKQEFQGDLYYDMTKAQLTFIEREFKGLHRWNLSALVNRIIVLDGKKEADRAEGEEISTKMLTLIDIMKKNSDPSLDVIVLASVYQDIGRFNATVGTNQCFKRAKHYLEEARDVIKTLGDRQLQWMIEGRIAVVEARISGTTPVRGTTTSSKENVSNDMDVARTSYNFFLRNRGENDVQTIQVGEHLASVLSGAYHTIEALRLLEKLAGTSRRVHGPSHQLTKKVALSLKQLQGRYVCINIDIGSEMPYQALRYENDGKSCVIQGPVPSNVYEPRNVDDEKTFSVPTALICFPLGTPVMLHGLKKAAHLNGEIGDVREFCQSTDRCVVHLEDKGLKPVKVKPENLRIVFDLVDPKKESS